MRRTVAIVIDEMNSSIALCTCLLGIFLSLPLFALARSRPANVWLALFILSLSLLSGADLYDSYPELWGLLDWPLALIGVSYYCYVRGMTGLRGGRWQALHFLPLGILVAVLVAIRLRYSGSQVFRWLGGDGRFVFAIVLLGFQAQAFAYCGAAVYRLVQYRRSLREFYSSTGKRDLVWLSWLTAVLILLLLLWIPSNLFGGVFNWALIVGRLAVLYFVGWYGLRQAPVFLSVSAMPRSGPLKQTQSELTSQPSAETLEPETEAVARGKYQRSGMTEAASELIGVRLARRMRSERDYLDSELKLSDLAERIGTSPQLLSQYLNEVAGQSFFEYVNALRVAEVQAMMLSPSSQGQTLMELAFAAGFNSKSTFNAAFKKINGLSPSAWRADQAAPSTPIGADA